MVLFTGLLGFAVFLGTFFYLSKKAPFTEWFLRFVISGLAVFFALFFVLIALGVTTYITVDQRPQAEQAAKAWASSLGYTEVIAVCASRDTDVDGYVSCTVSAKRGASMDTIPVECARQTLTLNEGCRVQRPGGAVQR